MYTNFSIKAISWSQVYTRFDVHTFTFHLNFIVFTIYLTTFTFHLNFIIYLTTFQMIWIFLSCDDWTKFGSPKPDHEYDEENEDEDEQLRM